MALPLTPQNVRGIMTHEVRGCPPDATVQQVAQLMSDLNVGTAPITEGDRLVGMVTDRDIALRVVARGLDPRSERIADYVTRDVATITPDAAIDDALQVMEARQIRRLPVVEGSRLVGIVSLGDFATRAPKPAGRRERLVGKALEEISQPSRPQPARAFSWRAALALAVGVGLLASAALLAKQTRAAEGGS
jgi:CBS domain-containing protein